MQTRTAAGQPCIAMLGAGGGCRKKHLAEETVLIEKEV